MPVFDVPADVMFSIYNINSAGSSPSVLAAPTIKLQCVPDVTWMLSGISVIRNSTATSGLPMAARRAAVAWSSGNPMSVSWRICSAFGAAPDAAAEGVAGAALGDAAAAGDGAGDGAGADAAAGAAAAAGLG